MGTMSGQNNQGIAHIGFKAGQSPFCKSRRALIVCAVEDVSKWPRLCVRCAGKLAKMNARKAERAA
jgi:hypothetical protein